MDSTLKEINLRKSIWNFIYTALNGVVDLHFNFLYDVPKDTLGNKRDSWVCVLLDDKELNTVSEIDIEIYLFTRKDSEGFVMSDLSDTVNEMFDNCNGIIPFYNYEASPLVRIGGLLIIRITEGNNMDGKDQVKLRKMLVRLKWVSKI